MTNLNLSPNAAAALESMRHILSQLPLSPLGLVAIGSVSLPGRWRPETSDIDLCIFVDNSWEEAITTAAQILRARLPSADVSITVPPHALIDLQNRRVEALVSHMGVSFDLTWLTGIDVYVGTSWYEIRRDYLELYIGNLYAYGIVLDGVRPPHPKFDTVHPYYPEIIRTQRLDELRLGLRKALANLRELPPSDYVERIVRFNSALLAFLQALFIFNRTYPISYQKHIEYQMMEMLSLDEASIGALRSDADLSNKEIIRLEEEWMNLLST